jgi:hypothetical protein
MEGLDADSNEEFSAYSCVSVTGAYTTIDQSRPSALGEQKNLFYIDSAANRHFCNDASRFENFDLDFIKEPILFGYTKGTALAKACCG